MTQGIYTLVSLVLTHTDLLPASIILGLKPVFDWFPISDEQDEVEIDQLARLGCTADQYV